MLGSILWLAAGCSGGGDDSCTRSADCVEGYSCNAGGHCVEAGPLAITTSALPVATVDVPFEAQLEAAGGIPPYGGWTLGAGAPGWLQIDADSGALSGTPDVAGSQLAVPVAVSDTSAGGGQTVERELALNVVECVEGAPAVCFEPREGKCMQGSRTCSDGVWSDCEGLVHSSHIDHCGPDCGACDTAVADGCHLGSCTCGAAQACTGADRCCLQQCIDAQNDDDNCGACGHACADAVAHADNPHCENGACDYDHCHAEYLDCDGDRSNGCETPRSMENCPACGVACGDPEWHASGIFCAPFGPDDHFRCQYEACEFGYYDCNDDEEQGDFEVDGCEKPYDRYNCTGCEQSCGDHADGDICVRDEENQVLFCGCLDENGEPNSDACQDNGQCCGSTCFPHDHPEHCGSCFNSCLEHPDGPVCVSDYDGTCGCSAHEDCGPLEICCDQVCRPIDEQNCGDCGLVCDPYAHGGGVCDLNSGVCSCEQDLDCRGFAGDSNTCVGEWPDAECVCEGSFSGHCGGGPDSVCCPDGGDNACVNTLTDPDHCGRCGIECDPGSDCRQGGCQCGDGLQCPANSPAPHCAGDIDRCICMFNPDPGKPCDGGRYCCTGSSGGMGGPDDGADEGCCWDECGKNAPGDCLY
jgi:hypothetical protein